MRYVGALVSAVVSPKQGAGGDKSPVPIAADALIRNSLRFMGSEFLGLLPARSDWWKSYHAALEEGGMLFTSVLLSC